LQFSPFPVLEFRSYLEPRCSTSLDTDSVEGRIELARNGYRLSREAAGLPATLPG